MERVTIAIPAASVKIIIGIHFVLTTWATLFSGALPTSYIFSNFILVIVGCWAIADRENTDPTIMFLLGMIFTIISDIVAISVYYNTIDNSTYRFSMGMAILNLILKPLFCICIFMEYRNRGGEVDTKWAENPYVTIDGQNADNRGGTPSQP